MATVLAPDAAGSSRIEGKDKPLSGRLMTVAELAEYLHVSRWKVYDMLRRGDLMAIQVGKRKRFDPLDIREQFPYIDAA